MLTIKHSERLSYLIMDDTDADLLFELDQDPAVMKHINKGNPTSRAEINDIFIPRMMQYRNPEKGWGLWQVNTLADDEFIGWILVRPMHFFSDERDDEDIELGWRFMQKSWGKGYATEAAKAVMTALQQQVGYTKFSAVAVPDNIGSIRMMEKLDMQYQKTALHKDPLGDLEAVYYSVTMESN
ncbi:GNAT family N-acetyltransferase [Marinicella gelatinilytica]|uniref:GNAT family N-acetyltransferase n=1 Tax=Marinicella gelatinilytica TaxID=2996017 RepID=UPI002260EC98|nr:GNAT family N-acetyltransferase [Marinicella gelatinilytica]MCX7545949.1 GNAT family N-acetyltransferase [Marinicella gelatinilytica]